jgi:hypothetical protein
MNIKGWILLIGVVFVMIVFFGAFGVFSSKKFVENHKCIKVYYNLYGEELYKSKCKE